MRTLLLAQPPQSTVRLIPGGWVIDKNLHRTPGVYDSLATALLARGLTDADKQLLDTAAHVVGGAGTIRYEAVWGAVNDVSDRIVIESVALRHKRSRLDLSGDSDIPNERVGVHG